MIECYYCDCPNHSCHFSYNEPFCNLDQCVATAKELDAYAKARKEQKEKKALTVYDESGFPTAEMLVDNIEWRG